MTEYQNSEKIHGIFVEMHRRTMIKCIGAYALFVFQERP